ncbi:Puromycin-sensitive aminopeptidase-like protein [Dinothrombium tinctorium]|uniref:Aminopeptidase n=1 Tax=Dinothrombium tinctorium TaxID=1965070 RepID=A0A3S4QZJ4_9ACAR|nr:Puromycin-sensitive aminopeptidase-like protein [Dinothrombium tinctorium]RWS09727.1 Puromycin-sensitive aminopeptidase-like protein [Dinothrombium tinctorium]RWS09946.1 Puromycin-sensitive aminopeptidase-like protein [Dinothrombium tinctorium]
MSSNHNASNECNTFSRLPLTVIPRHYDIVIKPDLHNFKFDGSELIDVAVKESTNKLILYAVDLTISRAFFTDSSAAVFEAEDIHSCNETEVLTITFASNLKPCNGQLSLEFCGNLNDKLKGFYRCKYVTPEGEHNYSAVTHFEPTDARRAFPCWDEPAFKSRFDLTLVVPKNKTTLSNMHIVEERVDGDLKTVKFATTPLMSTYLIAFVVGEYDFIEKITNDNVKVRVYTPLNKSEQGAFAVDVAAKALSFFRDYFRIPYPLSKLDLIAVSELSFGAMENWGLITYRESCLLCDAVNTSSSRREHIALIVAHEIAHQWFGNLVTMEWWTHLWLNEGFAEFMEYLCIDNLNIFSGNDLWTQFTCNISSDALKLDALRNSHPIEVAVKNPSEIVEIFDDISYRKGASLIRMLHDYIGDENFREGLHLYLKTHSYKNTITGNLWESFEEVSKKPIRKMMDIWTKETGYPLITITLDQNQNSESLILHQQRFFIDGKESENENTSWLVPISIGTQSNPTNVQKILLDASNAEFVLNDVKPEQWVKLNYGFFGFYRVHYPSSMLSQFIPAIKNKSLSALDRLNLQNDLFAIVKSGKASTVQLLKFLEAFTDEDNYSVWLSISDCLTELSTLLSHTDLNQVFNAYGRRLFSNVYERIGWEQIENEHHSDALLRSVVIMKLILFEDAKLIEEAKSRFENHVNGTAIIPADLRTSVYGAVAKDCNNETFETLFKLYRMTDLQEEKMRIARALGLVNEPFYIEQVLKFSLTDEVRSQDAVFWIAYVAANNHGRDAAWQFVQDNHEELFSRYESSFLLTPLYCTKDFASEEKAKEVERFFDENPTPAAARAVKQSLECIRHNAEWLSRDIAGIREYLLKQDS